MSQQFLIGADPELFIRNPNSGVLVSAHGKIPGTKHEPYPVKLGAVQVDGMALEFNIDPAPNVQAFMTNIGAVMLELKNMAVGYDFVLEPAVEFPQDVFDSAPEEAKELGCEPDYNGWTGIDNPRPDAATNLRTPSVHPT